MGSSSASSGVLLLLLLLLPFLSSLFVPAAARPCRTIFIAYAFSSDASDGGYSGASIEVSQISDVGDQRPSRFIAIYRLSPLRYYLRYPSYLASAEPLATADIRLPAGTERPAFPRHGLDAEPSFGISSLRERARDILAVVAGLLFGVGCAALTSASVYLAWYLINSRYEAPCAEGYDYLEDDESEDGMESPKKMGYVGLPASSAIPVAPLKEGSEGN